MFFSFTCFAPSPCRTKAGHPSVANRPALYSSCKGSPGPPVTTFVQNQGVMTWCVLCHDLVILEFNSPLLRAFYVLSPEATLGRGRRQNHLVLTSVTVALGARGCMLLVVWARGSQHSMEERCPSFDSNPSSATHRRWC